MAGTRVESVLQSRTPCTRKKLPTTVTRGSQTILVLAISTAMEGELLLEPVRHTIRKKFLILVAEAYPVKLQTIRLTLIEVG